MELALSLGDMSVPINLGTLQNERKDENRASIEVRGFDMNELPPEEIVEAAAAEEEGTSPNSLSAAAAASSKLIGFKEVEVEVVEMAEGLTRKKLRLSREQSSFLEESFKENQTLNPQQKLNLAKKLNLRPRQVEVWFQNRRARTKLKQTELKREEYKREFETLRELYERLQKEVQDLRTLKTTSPSLCMLPPTTLIICHECHEKAKAAAVAPRSIQGPATTELSPVSCELSFEKVK
ncbi:Homeobox-leucine zipper protein HAT14 [Acorus calamus]|uniref:Homeobox-leucine zipper protein HAT14 n=1 Tax=Acorus calamus TaxID=4465 RepID=A0AAV9CE68_ACOCL|nr:Homeobox-leucine zipper protein HAT14 [Acorus calamus]